MSAHVPADYNNQEQNFLRLFFNEFILALSRISEKLSLLPVG